MTYSSTTYVEWDSDASLYVGTVPGLPSAHTQGASVDELKRNPQEVVALCVEKYEGSAGDIPRFFGLQHVEIAV